MPKYLWLVTVLLIGSTFFILGCDETEQMMESVLTEPGTSVEDMVVDFPDPNLRVAVQGALDLASGDAITLGMLQTLTQLDAWDREITDLTGLEQATQLKVANLHNNAISDISPLAGLTHLTELSLSLNEISDISPLVGLTQLTELVLYENQISDISPLAGLTQLIGLGLRDNQITDISPLAELTRLTVLDLYGNNITNISPIVALVNLEFLFLQEAITDKKQLQSLLEKNPNLQINIDTNN
ncbi:MAG: leucine-rich repeat domain-containing protein [Candidatus Poribacteria bacterium]|nr:leucine-rich repeat domain-containing protein [Candidatus Poribacteria bacterium]